MAVYARDDELLFKKAITSVFNNSCKPDDFILVVDGPIPESLKTLVLYFEHLYFIRIIWLPKNIGLANALNFGLANVKTEWIARADSDDYNLPDRFETQIQMCKLGFDLIGSAIEEVDKFGNTLGFRITPESQLDIIKFTRYRNPFNHMTVFFRTSFVRNCGGYPNIYLKEDYALWATMISKGARIVNCSKVLVKASAGQNMYKRRGGLRSAKAEIDLQLHLAFCGIKSPFLAVFHCVIRAVIFLAPFGIRGFIYEKFLRNKQKTD